MKGATVRIAGVSIQNFKNVVAGELSFDNTRKNYRSSILGLYGQNGSGKTALIDAIELLQHALCGRQIPEKFSDYINVDSDEATLCFEFYIDLPSGRQNVVYQFKIKSILDETIQNTDSSLTPLRKVCIFNELIKCPILSEKQIKIGRLIDTDSEEAFTPRAKRLLLAGNEKGTQTDLLVIKKIVRASSRSFVFSREFLTIIRERTKRGITDPIQLQEMNFYTAIIDSLVEFGNHGLFVINTANSGLISLNAQPLVFRYEEENMGALGTMMFPLDAPFVIPNEIKILVDKVVCTMNIVLKQIIPGLCIRVKDLGTQIMDNGETGTRVQLMSLKNEKEIALKYESEGIKKIISILQLLINVYNHPSITVAVDELDNGVFEYLLGELLRIISEKGKGQLIFTSHNLRPLETLDRGFIAFTTTNPKNRYIRLTNVKENNNVRDLYYRNIMLGEKSEVLYEPTNNSEIALAFREAGEQHGA